MITDLTNTLLTVDGTVQEGISLLDANPHKIVLVVDENRHLLGTVTDGDIRRGILRAVVFDSSVTSVMNSNPRSATLGKSRDESARIMREDGVRHLPLLDRDGVVVGLETLARIEAKATKDNWVVLMAGGAGRRLEPLTNTWPKPLLKVGDKPVLETIIESLIAHGFEKFFMSVNYKADTVKSHFGNGSAWGAEFHYLDEAEPLGTAGSLSLLPKPCSHPLLVMNGDILTRVNFENLIEFHADSGAAATMCIREYDFEVPFGVVDVASYRVSRIVEKPVHSFFVNAGIYVLDPEVLGQLPRGEYFDMPELFDLLIGDNKEVAAYPIREYWIDIGRKQDLMKAEHEYAKAFK